MQTNEYTKQAEEFIAKHELEFRAVLIGDDCPTFCADAEAGKDMDKVNVFPRKTHIHGKHYRCTFSRKGKGHFSVDFWNSYANEEENYFAFGSDSPGAGYGFGRTNCYWDKYRFGGKYPGSPRAKKRIVPTAYDVLACVTKSDPGTFEDFCSDFGYDTDSRKAEGVYRAVIKEWRSVERFFTPEEITELQEIS